MKKFTLFRPFRNILVLYQQGYSFYRFRFGKCIEAKIVQGLPTSDTLISTTEILIACPLQDTCLEQTPPLKYLDRPAFLFHSLSHHFKTTKWIAARWLTATSFTGFRFSDIPENNLKTFQGIYGAFLGELSRFSIFETREGCLLAPTKLGQLYQIYIKNAHVRFARLVAFEDFNITTDLEVLKRHLERYYQANLQTLEVKWWGPHAPLALKVHQESDFEENVLQNYIQYSHPFLRCQPKLNSEVFQWHGLKQKLKLVSSVFGVILFFLCFYNMYEIFEIKKHHDYLQETFVNQQKIYQVLEQNKPSSTVVAQQTYQKKITETLVLLMPLAKLPWDHLEKISRHVKNKVRCHEFIWLRGDIRFHSTDHSFDLHPSVFEKQLKEQSMVMAITGPDLTSLKNFDHLLEKNLGQDFEIKSWAKTKVSKAIASYEPLQGSDKKRFSCLVQVIQKS